MSVYDSILARSNLYYNQGLECAKLRNLTGAISALRKSVHCYKGNIDARNLLGLCYYEVGEYVLALREWVISENLKPEENPASGYIAQIKPDMSRTGKYSQYVKKYNQALEYAKGGSEDLAILQLKKAVSMNPKYLQALLLLALLYIHEGQFPQAKDVLTKANKVDVNNLQAQLYMEEVKAGLALKNTKSRKRNVSDDSVEYKSGSETVIRPAYFKDNATISTIINIIFGIVVGFLISFFLVVPGVRRHATADSAAKLVEANNKISTKNVAIRNYQEQIDELNKKIEDAEKNSSKSEGSMNLYKGILKAYMDYESGKYEKAGETLAEIDENEVDKDFLKSFKKLKKLVNDRYLRILYKQAAGFYNQAEYEKAIETFETIIKIDEEYGDGDALYFGAQSYRMNGNSQKAIVMYQRVINMYPDTYKARNAQRYLDQLKNQ
ncbi:MAG: tetratricopeptide repeat protein [Lachnospiraceae bacterium]|nr:tetratricopeptide repeat protein [Lachnospiraceae bacterium]